jgi:hypothetical protein
MEDAMRNLFVLVICLSCLKLWAFDHRATEKLTKHLNGIIFDAQIRNSDWSQRIKELIERGANPNAKTVFRPAFLDDDEGIGYTALHFAAEKNNIDLIRFLLRHPSTNIDAKSLFFTTPLMCAAIYGREEAIEILLSQRASVFAWDKHYRTAFGLADERGHQNVMDILAPYYVRPIDFELADKPYAKKLGDVKEAIIGRFNAIK